MRSEILLPIVRRAPGREAGGLLARIGEQGRDLDRIESECLLDGPAARRRRWDSPASSRPVACSSVRSATFGDWSCRSSASCVDCSCRTAARRYRPAPAADPTTSQAAGSAAWCRSHVASRCRSGPGPGRGSRLRHRRTDRSCVGLVNSSDPARHHVSLSLEPDLTAIHLDPARRAAADRRCRARSDPRSPSIRPRLLSISSVDGARRSGCRGAAAAPTRPRAPHDRRRRRTGQFDEAAAEVDAPSVHGTAHGDQAAQRRGVCRAAQRQVGIHQRPQALHEPQLHVLAGERSRRTATARSRSARCGRRSARRPAPASPYDVIETDAAAGELDAAVDVLERVRHVEVAQPSVGDGGLPRDDRLVDRAFDIGEDLRVPEPRMLPLSPWMMFNTPRLPPLRMNVHLRALPSSCR